MLEPRTRQSELEVQNDELRHKLAALEEAQGRYLDLYEFASVGYVTLNQAALISDVSMNGAALLGDERQELLHCAFAEFVPPEERANWRKLFSDMLTGGHPHSAEITLRRRNGACISARINGMRLIRHGSFQGVRLALIDITDLAELRRVVAETRISAIVFESQQAMMITDAQQRILKVNSAFTRLTGYSAEDVAGQHVRLVKSGRHDAAFFAGMWDTLNRQGSWQGELWDRRKDGEIFPSLVTITEVKADGRGVTHYVGTMIDITERKAIEAKIEHLAFYDSLTRLPNRRLLLDRLQRALLRGERSGRDGALMFIDLDEFKLLNDTLGHENGDRLLVQVAERLSACVREGDTVARLGGDEFVVLLENLSGNESEAASDAERVGEKMLAALNATFSIGEFETHSSASIGVALFNGHGDSADDLMRRADMAMYQAKAAGRNALRFFDPTMQAKVFARTELEHSLRGAIGRNEFTLHFQPQVSDAGATIGSEALIRWQDPARGLVLPDQFIPLAEKTGLILPLGLWVLEKACEQLAEWAGNPLMRQLSLSVNVSARQFHQPDFVDQVAAIVSNSGADPHKLKLEITESAMLSNVEDTINKMRLLRRRGIGLSLDDFGTGYSSLSYLKLLPLDQLKIDRSFIRNLITDPDDSAITKMVVGLARDMRLSVVAEGVETAAQRDFLSNHGCLEFQGFLFSAPLPRAEFDRLLAG